MSLLNGFCFHLVCFVFLFPIELSLVLSDVRMVNSVCLILSHFLLPALLFIINTPPFMLILKLSVNPPLPVTCSFFFLSKYTVSKLQVLWIILSVGCAEEAGMAYPAPGSLRALRVLGHFQLNSVEVKYTCIIFLYWQNSWAFWKKELIGYCDIEGFFFLNRNVHAECLEFIIRCG